MAINVFQVAASTNDSSDVAARTITWATTLAGSVLEVFVGMVSNSAVSAVTDTQGNTYTKIQEVTDGTTNWKVEHWVAVGIAGGACVTTVTFTFTAGQRNAIGKEIREATVLDSFAAAYPATPTTTTDALSSGNASVAQQPALISALAVSAVSSAQPAAGTGFTSNGTAQAFFGFNYGYRMESKRITANGAQAALFTAGANERHAVLMAVYRETVAAGTGSPLLARKGSGGFSTLSGGFRG